MKLILMVAAVLAMGPVWAPSASAACSDPAAPEVDWKGCDKRGADLAGADLQRANLSGIDLSVGAQEPVDCPK